MTKEFIEWWYRYLVLSAAPGYAIAVSRKYMRTDIRPILPLIHVPELVLYRSATRNRAGSPLRATWPITSPAEAPRATRIRLLHLDRRPGCGPARG